jgi:hypothetical protein
VSGGQTGADRGGLDSAIENGIPHGGRCPKGRLAEDGPIDPCHELQKDSSNLATLHHDKHGSDLVNPQIMARQNPKHPNTYEISHQNRVWLSHQILP